MLALYTFVASERTTKLHPEYTAMPVPVIPENVTVCVLLLVMYQIPTAFGMVTVTAAAGEPVKLIN